MPSIVYQSSSMASRRLALVSQNVTEQANGLVEVNVEYAALASARDRVLPLFKTDLPPPIMPDMVNLSALQTQRLYLRNFSNVQANGTMLISASYVGANFSALDSPAIYSDFELFNFQVQTDSYYTIIMSGISFAGIDYYGFDCNLRVEEQQAAVIDRQQIALGPPPAFAESNREGLVMGAAFSFRSIHPGFVASRDQPLIGFRYRDMTASEILAAMAQKQPDGTSGFNVAKTQKVEHITPTVKLISDVYRPELNSGALFNIGFLQKRLDLYMYIICRGLIVNYYSGHDKI
jgi:hypothetical protein